LKSLQPPPPACKRLRADLADLTERRAAAHNAVIVARKAADRLPGVSWPTPLDQSLGRHRATRKIGSVLGSVDEVLATC
jgi:hypothetical protein